MAHPNEEAVRKAYEAFAAGDMDTVQSILDPGVKWHVVGRSSLAGTYEGIDQVIEFLGRIMQITDGTFRVDIQDVLANDDYAVTLAHVHAQRAGRTLESEEAHVSSMKAGRVAEFWALTEDQYAVDEFFE